MNDLEFWNDKELANQIIKETNALREIINPTIEITKNISDGASKSHPVSVRLHLFLISLLSAF